MPYKPTGNPPGRPKTKEYDTLLARVPQDVVDRVKAYSTATGQSISALIREGLEWRIGESNSNGHTTPTPLDWYARLGHDDSIPALPCAAGEMQAFDLAPSVQANTIPSVQPEVKPALDFDTATFSLGVLCQRGHDWRGTGQSLRHKGKRDCVECKQERRSGEYERRRQRRRNLANVQHALQQAYQAVGHGRSFVDIPALAKQLGWPTEQFHTALKDLRRRQVIELHGGDTSQLSAEALGTCYRDEHGGVYVTVSWRA